LGLQFISKFNSVDYFSGLCGPLAFAQRV